MSCRLAAAVIACLVLLAPAALAQEKPDSKPDREPQVYFFWSASCPFSKAARTFLHGAQARDAGLKVRDFEVDGSIANMRLLGRLYERVGMPDVRVVPVTVIGHHVVIGYIDDATTGAEILGDVEECRKAGCTDAVRDLIERQDRFEAVAAAQGPVRRVACEREPGRAVRQSPEPSP
jgi:hypothetical protein